MCSSVRPQADEPPRARRAGLLVTTSVGEFPFLSLPFAVLGVVVTAAAHGVWASVGEGVTTVAVLGLLKWVWRRFGPRPRLSNEQVRLYSTVCISIFLVSSSAYIGWAMEGPGSTCVDCDTT